MSNKDTFHIISQYEHEYQGIHTHSGREDLGFSSILYLKVPDFGKEITKTGTALNGKTELVGNCGGTWSSPTQLITPKVGDFYIFQASHQHFVMPFKAKTPKEIRLSMSFNFIIKEKSNVQ